MTTILLALFVCSHLAKDQTFPGKRSLIKMEAITVEEVYEELRTGLDVEQLTTNE